MKTTISVIAVAAFITAAISFTHQQPDPWKVPEKYEKMKNPVKADDASTQSGKELYSSYCRSCHGTNGKGTGKRADNLNIPPSDFTSQQFQQQTDGSLLYKVYFGHKDMPGFKKKLPGTNDVMDGSFGKTRNPGDLINYLRTFGAK